LLVGATTFSFGQKSGYLIEASVDAQTPFSITQYTLKHGLPQSQVIDIVPKSNGSLLISTANGIVEFDGNQFTEIIPFPNYKNNIYLSLFWMEETQQLFGGSSDGSLQMLLPQQKEFGGYRTIQIDKVLYTVTKEGILYKLQNPYNQQQVVATIPIGKNNPIQCFYFLKDILYYSTAQGFFLYDLQKKITTKINNTPVVNMEYDPILKSLFLIHNQSISIFSLKNNTFSSYFSPSFEEPTFVIFDIESINEFEKFVCTNQGFYLINPNGVTHFDKSNLLPSLYYNKGIYLKSENCLFLGSGNKGLLKLQLKKCYSFGAKDGFTENNSLNSIVSDSKGYIYVGSSQSKVYKVQKDSIHFESKLKANVSSLSIIDDTLYLGTWGEGIYTMTNKGELLFNFRDSSDNYRLNIHAIFKDLKSNLWVGTGNGILKGTNLFNLKPYKSNEIKGQIITFYTLKNGTLCIGGSNGVYLLNQQGEIIKHLSKKEGITGKEVRSFYEDYDGKLWIGTYNGGLYCYENNILTSINSLPNCMLDRDAFTLVPDEYGYLNITSNKGLWRVSEKQLNEFYKGELDYLIPFIYGEEDGIFNSEFNGGFQNNFTRDLDGKIYFPSIEGLVVYNPDSIFFRKLFPSVSKVIIGNKIIDFNQTITTQDERNIEIHFSSPNFLSKYNVYYQFKLERNGEKKPWSNLQKISSINYPALQPGNYVFSLRSIDALNDKKPILETVQFTIQPYFYETWWFYLSITLISVVIVAIIINNRITKKRVKALQKERQKRKIAQLELIAIQSQMNPHFIFNCLNSIKYFIAINDPHNADVFLDNFSILLRKFIEYSNRPFIQINEEVILLKAYLELEKHRSNPNFEIELMVDPSINNKKIPTFIIQPFVENAIKHGILHATHACKLSIRFSKLETFIICEIEDNGIGRQKSHEINQSNLKHASKGTQLINDKMSSLEELYDLKIVFEIEDLLTQDEPSGTKVTLKIPIKHD
jgi:ligand-binding sensor domain-containing protein